MTRARVRHIIFMTEKNILQEAYDSLCPNASVPKTFSVVYTGRMKDYGSTLSMNGRHLELKLSRQFYTVAREIQIGMAQELLCKLLRKKKDTIYIDLYNNFVKNLHLAVPKNRIDPELEESFDRVNERYFLGLVEKPNLRWGRQAVRTFGSYDFKNDTITISRIFRDADPRYVDYIMFHEMLHKQRKFKSNASRTTYHDSKFKRAEKIFKDSDMLEKELGRFATKERAKAFFRWRR
jgi:predicted metal-dependent hydrolase